MVLLAGTKTLRWQSWDGTGFEQCVIRSDGVEFLAEGVGLAPQADGFAFRYAIRFDGNWHTQSVKVAVLEREQSLSLAMDGQGCWTCDALPAPHLNDAIAPDLSASPITNTLAIRRLNLAQGESAEIETAYVDLPSMTVFSDPQRYTCLQAGRVYRYESRDSDFQRDIAIDEDGFVLTYPGLFRRVW